MRAVSTACRFNSCRFTLSVYSLPVYYGRSTIRYGSGVAIARLTLDGTNEDFD